MKETKSPIEEYYLYRNGVGKKPIGDNLSPSEKLKVSNEHLHQLLVNMREEQYNHLLEQDELLTIIRNQSRPQFIREVGANVVGSFIYDGIRHLFRCFKI